MLKSYYLLPWIGFAIVFLLKALFGESANSLQEDILVGQVFAIVLALFVGTIYYLGETKWAPYERRKRLRKTPFKELREIGFTETDNLLIGKHSDFQIIAKYNWSGTEGDPSIMIIVLFNPKQTGVFMPVYKLNKLNHTYKKQNLVWSLGSIHREWSFKFKAPKFDKIELFITLATDILKKEKFEPFLYKQFKIIESDCKHYLEAEKGDNKV